MNIIIIKSIYQKNNGRNKKDTEIFKESVKKSGNEFNIIKIRFSEVLDFIKDKQFWNKFITKIIEKNDLNDKINSKN